MSAILALLVLAAAPDPRAAVRDALQQGNLLAAIQAAKPGPQAGVDARACYAALLEENGQYKEAAAIRKQLPPAPAAEPAPPAKLEPKAFVAASKLALRASASASAPALVLLPIGTPVEVLDPSGTFARVRVALPAKPVRVVEFDVSGAETAPKIRIVPGGPTEGFVAAAYLSNAPPDRAALVKSAESADAAERATALDRLAALTRDRATYARLAAAAFDAGRCTIAAYAAAVVGGRVDVLGGYAVEAFEIAYGCRGDRLEAQPVTPSDTELSRKKVPANACAVEVAAVEPCDFCPLGFESEDSPAALREKRRVEKVQAAYEKRKAALDALFRDGPYFHARLRRQAEPPGPLVAVSVSTHAEECGDTPPPEDTGFEAHPLTLPNVQPGEAIDVWMKVPAYVGFVYGLVPTRSVDEARKLAIAAKTVSRNRDRFVSGARFVAVEPGNCCCD